MRWETERSLDGKFCQEYLYQKLSKADTSYSRKCRGYFFETQYISLLLTLILCIVYCIFLKFWKTSLLYCELLSDGILVRLYQQGYMGCYCRLTTLLFLSLLSLFYHVYAYIELTPSDFLPTFAIKFMHWPVTHITLLMSLFFGAHCLGRFLGIPLSFVLRPRTMIVINLVVTAVACIILLAVKTVPDLLWVSAALAGGGMATTFATVLLWMSESIAISGRVASVVVASISVGSIIQPQIVGRLFQVPAAGGPMSMVYVLVTSSLIHIVLFICMLLFVAQCFGKNGEFRNTLVSAPASARHAVE